MFVLFLSVLFIYRMTLVCYILFVFIFVGLFTFLLFCANRTNLIHTDQSSPLPVSFPRQMLLKKNNLYPSPSYSFIFNFFFTQSRTKIMRQILYSLQFPPVSPFSMFSGLHRYLNLPVNNIEMGGGGRGVGNGDPNQKVSLIFVRDCIK